MIPAILVAHTLVQDSKTEITVYNQGLGFVKDVRTVDFKAGPQQFIVDDVAQLIDATSVGFKCLSNPGSISVLEQNYQYDLVSPEAILQKSVGKRIRFTRSMGGKKESVDGILLSSPSAVVNTGAGGEYSYNGLVIRTDDGRIILSPEGEIDVLEMPEGLISKPSLLWQVESSAPQQAKIELSYLTKGMSWNANYVLTIDNKGTGDLQGWVTLNNQSGLSFKDATLKLLAGDVNVVKEEQDMRFRDTTLALNRPSEKRAMTEESLFEYHLYTLNRPATVRNKESKQLGLLEGFNIPVKKVIQIDSYENSPGENNIGEQQEFSGAVKIKFTNDQKSHLGMPMPAGKVRLFQRDAGGSLQFLGEDQIQHTPRDEKITLAVGNAFDVKASRKKTNFQRLLKKSSRTTYEMEIRNRKTTDETVTLYEHGYSGALSSWKITSQGNAFTKVDARTMVLEVKLKAGEVRKVTYTVEAKW